MRDTQIRVPTRRASGSGSAAGRPLFATRGPSLALRSGRDDPGCGQGRIGGTGFKNQRGAKARGRDGLDSARPGPRPPFPQVPPTPAGSAHRALRGLRGPRRGVSSRGARGVSPCRSRRARASPPLPAAAPRSVRRELLGKGRRAGAADAGREGVASSAAGACPAKPRSRVSV